MGKGIPHISIIIPVYHGEGSLHELHRRLTQSLGKITSGYEIIMVNDASPDRSWAVITELCERDNHVKGINFSRNFGQHYAITAGIDHSSGEWVVVMDCDLQDQPEEISKLYEKSRQGYDVVFARRYSRKDGFFKKAGSKLFYMIYDYFTETRYDSTIANFSISNRSVIENFKKMRERNRSYPLFIHWLGFNVGFVDVEHAERFSGKSSYTFSKLMNLAIDVVISFSNKPLKLSIKFGFIMSLLSVFYGLFLVIRFFVYDIPVQGWTSLMVAIFFLSGLILANMGILGLYIGKTFDESKNRPLYIIKDTAGSL